MSWSPHVTVAAVVTDRQGRHLLVEETPDGIAVFNQPAGHLEAGESLVEAVIREVREETCRDFTPKYLVGIYQWTSERGISYLRFCFSGSVSEPLPGCSLDPDIVAARWLDPALLESGQYQPRSPLVLRCIHDHLQGAHLPLEALHALV